MSALDEKSPTSRLMAECEAAEIRDVAFAFEQLKTALIEVKETEL